ncbi:AsmA family protein [Agaribacterium sp. ZY112]|uniref:AsmA family protein n=1 Tax=Agaribacterium sp. ZY112 TaxID=3233574 RepID=UPI0035238E5E
MPTTRNIFIKTLAYVVATVVVLLILLTTALFLVDFGHFKESITHYLSTELERDVRIDGQLRIKLLPRPTLSINELSIANPSWAKETELLQLKELNFAASYQELLQGQSIIRHIAVHGLNLHLESNAKGQNSWDFPTLQSAEQTNSENEHQDNPSAPLDHLPVLLQSLEISDVKLKIDQAGNEPRVLTLSSLQLQLEAEQNYQIQAQAQLDHYKLKLKLMLSDIHAFSYGKTSDYQLELKLNEHQLNSKGEISNIFDEISSTGHSKAQIASKILLDDLGIDVLKNEQYMQLRLEHHYQNKQLKLQSQVEQAKAKLNIETQLSTSTITNTIDLNDLDALGQLFALEGLPKQALNLDSQVNLGKEHIDIQKLNIKTKDLSAEIQASIGDTSNADIKLNSPSLEGLLEGFVAAESIPKLPLSLNAKLSQDGQTSSADIQNLSFGDTTLKGLIKFVNADTASIHADIHAALVDARPWLKTEDTETDNKEQDNKNSKDKNQSRYVFTEDKLDLSPLKQINADLNIEIERLLLEHNELSDIQLNTQLSDGDLSNKLKLTGPKSSSINSEINLLQRDKAELSLILDLDNISYELKDKNGKELQSPLTNVDIALKSQGLSARELAEESNGKIVITQGSGKVDNKLMSRFSSDIIEQLLNALNPFANKEPYTNWECTVFTLDITQGDAQIGTMLAQTDKLLVVGGGDINLNNEKLNIEFNTKPRKGVGVSADMFVTPFVRVAGTLKSPALGLNKSGVLLSGSAAVMTGGMSLLAQSMLDRATANSDHCADAMATLSLEEQKKMNVKE